MKTSELYAPVFMTIHSSFVDGWGIRTTIFLKGCPLRCMWCCNPEGQRREPELSVSYDKCTGCGRCVDSCDIGALSIGADSPDGNKIIVVNRNLCTGCGKCVDSCWYGALDMFGIFRTPEDVFAEVVKDKPFYDESGGGLTIGGGEATLYPEFCLRLIELCHSEGINVAIDSCGQTGEAGRNVYAAADLVLFDIKGMDEDKHIAATGIGTDVIRSNLEYLDSIGKPVIIRIPVIPGHNASDAQLHEAAQYLCRFRCIERVDLIPFHEFGKVKYARLDKPYLMNADSIPDERQKAIKSIFEGYGLRTQLGG